MKPEVLSRWISIDSVKYDSDSVESSDGVELHVFVSPYDLPSAVRGRVDGATRRFVIDFKYLSEEPQVERRIDEHVSFSIGKHSHRVYRIEADVEGLGANVVTLRLVPAIDKLAKALQPAGTPHDNFRVAKEILEDSQSELTRQLVGAA